MWCKRRQFNEIWVNAPNTIATGKEITGIGETSTTGHSIG